MTSCWVLSSVIPTFDETVASRQVYDETAIRCKALPRDANVGECCYGDLPPRPDRYTLGKSARTFATNPIFDYTTSNFGVDNTIAMPWMMRRQYCNYTFYLIEAGNNDPATYGKVDALTYTNNTASNAHASADVHQVIMPPSGKTV